MSNTPELLINLNSTNLAKDNNRLYQVIKSLISNLLGVEQAIGISVTTGGSTGSGFVTTTIGGNPSTVSMFTSPHNIENVSAEGISAALDLL